jgi:hypothetical protein
MDLITDILSSVGKIANQLKNFVQEHDVYRGQFAFNGV